MNGRLINFNTNIFLLTKVIMIHLMLYLYFRLELNNDREMYRFRDDALSIQRK